MASGNSAKIYLVTDSGMAALGINMRSADLEVSLDRKRKL
jgi:hypothetical protein